MPITPVKDSNNVLLGLGVLGLAAWPLASPLVHTDVGYIKSCEIAYSRELKDFESAGILVKRLVFRDRFNLKSNWAEVSVANLKKLIPYTSVTNGLAFGGDRSITRYSVLFEHTISDDDGGERLLSVRLYKSIIGGEVTLNFAEEEYITYPTEFSAEADTTKAAGQQYGYITIADI